MKKLLFFVLTIFILGYAYSQNSGKGFSYQAVTRSGDGQVKASANIELKFGLYPGKNAITPTWEETHITTTDEFGICNLIIGTGIKSGGTIEKYGDLEFSSAEYWLKVAIRDNGVFVDIHKMQLLSVPYAEVSFKSDGVPVGTIVAFGGEPEMIPQGWMLCDGKTLDRAEYNNLYKIIGNAWGHGNSSTSFNIPDLRGFFLRGVDMGQNRDNDRNTRVALKNGGNTGDKVGSRQSDSFKEHDHGGQTGSAGEHSHKLKTASDDGGSVDNTVAVGDTKDERDDYITSPAPNHRHKIDPEGGSETRPDNVNVNYIIKVR